MRGNVSVSEGKQLSERANMGRPHKFVLFCSSYCYVPSDHGVQFSNVPYGRFAIKGSDRRSFFLSSSRCFLCVILAFLPDYQAASGIGCRRTVLATTITTPATVHNLGFQIMSISLYQTRLSPCPTIVFVGQGCYEEVVSKLLPLRYHVGDIGGSRAQEDVVHLTLIDAASRIPDQVCFWACV